MAKLTHRCPDCREHKEPNEFYTHKNRSTGRSAHCKVCHRIRVAAGTNRERKKEYTREYNLINKYGINTKTYQAILERQGGGCAVCTDTTDLVVDHNHDTGEVRGVLCRRCNSGLGQFKDFSLLLRAAAEYLGG